MIEYGRNCQLVKHSLVEIDRNDDANCSNSSIYRDFGWFADRMGLTREKGSSMTDRGIPDWKLPRGVSREVWQCAQSEHAARGYDASLAHSALHRADQQFAERHLVVSGRLIDFGCGTGRLLIPFAQRGAWVLGVDLSAEMLRLAGAKAMAAGVAIARLQANLVELDCLADASFDSAACLFSTLGMIAGARERRSFIGHVHRILRPNGRFVLHVHNLWFNFWDAAGRRWLLRDALRQLLRRPDAGDRPVPEGVIGFPLHHFSRREAVRMLREARFRIREVLPVGVTADANVRSPWWFGWLRCYGYLVAAEKAAD